MIRHARMQPAPGARGGRPRVALAAALSALALALTAAGAGSLARAAEPKLKVPRFVSLRFATVHMRVGPGLRYPIRWIYHRRHMPVEVLRDYQHWRYVRDWWGARGWIHISNLSGDRTVLIVGSVRRLRKEPSASAPVVARAEPTVVGRVVSCKDRWCRVSVGRYAGWVQRAHVWGVYPEETIR